MEQEIQIEELKKSDYPEMLELFTCAFKDYPIATTLHLETEKTRAVIETFLNFFGGMKTASLYGIRKDNKLVCASLSVDSATKPSVVSLIRFIFSLMRIFRHSTREFEKIHSERPKYKERYLELVLISTLPEYQRQGFGRKMLHFLCEKAIREDYKGVILVVRRDAPALQWYLKEKFSVEREFLCGEVNICWMRLIFRKDSADSA